MNTRETISWGFWGLQYSDQVVSALEIALCSPLYLLQLKFAPVEDLNTIPDTVWTKNSADFGKTIGAEPVKVQIDPANLLHKLFQYLLEPKAKKGIRSVVEYFMSKGLLILCTSPCNTSVLPVNILNGWRYRFVQDLRILKKKKVSLPNST